jgi:hypothetical protein
MPLFLQARKRKRLLLELSNHHRQNTVTAKFQEERTFKTAENKFKTALLCCL